MSADENSQTRKTFQINYRLYRKLRNVGHNFDMMLPSDQS